MLTMQEINDLCIKNTPLYIKTLKENLDTRTPLADKLGLTSKGAIWLSLIRI